MHDPSTELSDWLCAYLAAELRLPAGSIDPSEPMSSYGLDSVRAITLLTEVEDHVLGASVDPFDGAADERLGRWHHRLQRREAERLDALEHLAREGVAEALGQRLHLRELGHLSGPSSRAAATADAGAAARVDVGACGAPRRGGRCGKSSRRC